MHSNGSAGGALNQLIGRCLLCTIQLTVVGCGRFSLSTRSEPAASHDVEPTLISVTIAAERLELFMEHPLPVQGEPVKSNVHLTMLNDGMPIRSGKLTMVATGPSGMIAQTEQAAPKSPGIFGPTIAFPEPGENRVALSLQSDQAEETINVTVVVYADEVTKKKAEHESEEAEPESAIKFLKEQQWKIGLVTEPAGKRRLVDRLTVPGQIVPSAGAKAVVTPPIAGRVLPPPAGTFPRVGQQVEAGQIVAVIEPPLAGPQGVELMVNRAQIQSLETGLAVKQLDVEVEIKKAAIELEHAQQVQQRIKALSAQGTTPGKQLQEAERDLKLAETNYDSKLRLREPYEQARRELQAMLNSEGAGRN